MMVKDSQPFSIMDEFVALLDLPSRRALKNMAVQKYEEKTKAKAVLQKVELLSPT